MILLRLVVFCFLLLISEIDASIYTYEIEQTSDDGTEVGIFEWLVGGYDGENYLGNINSKHYSSGLRFLTPDLQKDQKCIFARIKFPSIGSVMVSSARFHIFGILQDNPATYSHDSRPSQKRPFTEEVVYETYKWGVKGSELNSMALYYSTPDLSPIVNKVLSQREWGSTEKAVAFYIKDASEVDNYVKYNDKSNFYSKATAVLEVYESAYDTFLGKEVLGRITDDSVIVNLISIMETDVYVEYGKHPGLYTNSTDVYLNNPSEKVIEVALRNLDPDTKYYYRAVVRKAGGTYETGEERSFRTQRPKGAAFKFSVTADEHIHQSHGGDGEELFKVALGNIANGDPDFYLSLGDFVGTQGKQGKAKNLQDTRQRYLLQREYIGLITHSIPFFHVLGNHEGEQLWFYRDKVDYHSNIAIISSLARKEMISNPYPDGFYTGNLKRTTDYYGENYYAWEWGDALFVVLDPYQYTEKNPEKTDNAWDWTIGHEQYDWLYETLHDSDSQWKFVFIHHLTSTITPKNYGRGGIEIVKHIVDGRPSFEWGGEDETGNMVFNEMRPGWEYGPIHDLLVEEGVDILFHGHDHVFVKQDLDGVVYHECPKPNDKNYGYGFVNKGGYIYGTILPNSGHLEVTVDPEFVKVDYVRAYLPGHGTNAQIDHTYIIENVKPECHPIRADPGSLKNSSKTNIVLKFIDEHSGINLDSLSVIVADDLAFDGHFKEGYSGSIEAVENGYGLTINPDKLIKKRGKVRVEYRVSDNANIPNELLGEYHFKVSSERRAGFDHSHSPHKRKGAASKQRL